MSPMRPAAIVLLLLGHTGLARAGAVVIDPMTVELAPNDCLPVTMPRLATWGAWCDAPSCPPGTVSPETDCQNGDQPAFGSELVGPARTTQVWAEDFTTSIQAWVDPVARRMYCRTSGGYASALDVMYSDAVNDLWEGDLLAMGTTAVEAVVEGAVSAENPLFLRIAILSNIGTPDSPNNTMVTHMTRVEAPGTYRVPLESFAVDPPDRPFPPNFHRVTLIWFNLSQCDQLGCADTGLPAATYALGPLSLITAEPTTARRTSWSQVKRFYR